ncbi:Neprosin activation peptide domain-containing protein [Dioscorea alata]|uniref:Neprosin activation peptide domain-containing protein n=1 Tax=Dioscorea alata TaxID=55571 RepID=A0ACB7VE60_DIOAL|nr:Neprosin activation peptide domain-containing protein [Dioscorea alata]
MEYGKQLGSLNKISIKTIKDKYGEIYHCIIMYEQPAFNHPSLKNHTIQGDHNFIIIKYYLYIIYIEI